MRLNYGRTNALAQCNHGEQLWGRSRVVSHRGRSLRRAAGSIRKLPPRHGARDVVQEAFLRLHREFTVPRLERAR